MAQQLWHALSKVLRIQPKFYHGTVSVKKKNRWSVLVAAQKKNIFRCANSKYASPQGSGLECICDRCFCRPTPLGHRPRPTPRGGGLGVVGEAGAAEGPAHAVVVQVAVGCAVAGAIGRGGPGCGPLGVQ